MKFEELRCDRCEKAIKAPAITVTVNYHHPATLDLCETCEAHLAMWLGHHPLWKTRDREFAQHTGEGYPTPQQCNYFLAPYARLRKERLP